MKNMRFYEGLAMTIFNIYEYYTENKKIEDYVLSIVNGQGWIELLFHCIATKCI